MNGILPNPLNTHSLAVHLPPSLMGNIISNRASNSTGKVILSDGTVHEFEQPITVAELMLEHPQQVVVEFQSVVTNGKRPTPLPADKKLDMKKVYLMLPMKSGGMKPSTLSSEEARRLLLSANSVLKDRSFLSSSRFLPLFAKICPTGAGGENGHGVVMQRNEGLVENSEEREKLDIFSDISDERPEYLSRQFSGKGWKPSLDTIKEKKVEKKMPHWLF